MYNKLEYFTYNTVVLVYIIMGLIILALIISSSTLIQTSIQISSLQLELILTISCFVIIWVIISPALIYILDFDLIIIPTTIIHTLGLQWFWSYQCVMLSGNLILDQSVVSFSNSQGSYLAAFNSSLLIASSSLFKFLIYSFDVIHSFGIYSFGLKYDAIPGRFHFSNSLRSFLHGSYFGFCYELCGRSHSSMLIHVRIL